MKLPELEVSLVEELRRAHGVPTFAAFERALAPDAPLDALDALVDHVVGRAS